MLTARTGDSLPVSARQRPIQPAVVGRLAARRARFHIILRVEMRARRVGRAHGVHDRQLSRVVNRLQRPKRRVQAEQAVEIDGRIGRAVRARNRDGGPQIVIALLAVRDHDVQSVHRAALEDRDQDFLSRSWAHRRHRGRGRATPASTPTPTIAKRGTL